MIPDHEQRMNDMVDKASLKDVMPEFDEELQWQQLSPRLPMPARRIPIRVWAYAAAILLLVGIGSLRWYMSATGDPVATASNNQQPDTGANTAGTGWADTIEQPVNNTATSGTTAEATTVKKQNIQPRQNNPARRNTTGEVIHNGTPCPIEVRISQVMKCPNKEHKAISSCSTLEPDQSAELNYKERNTVAANCSLTIKEIEIRSIATGEVILLNSSSTPSTVQEVFSYITGEKKGDVLAGVFDHDCNKKKNKHSLRLNNSNGNLSIQ